MNEPADPEPAVASSESFSPGSPCIKICVLDADQICVGCGRQLQEIADWSRMGPDEQRLVNARAAARLSSRI